jgi:ABC-type transport system involved in multi-copper enzyme maturation permease subunit
MNLTPVIGRELRSQSRSPFTYYLRVIGVVAAIVVAASVVLDGISPDRMGPLLFQRLHQTFFVAIWILVPMLTADCISMERREGTIGLLFLTPLKPFEIVLSKAAAGGIRAFTFWLSTLPVLAIAFMAGGVTWLEGVASVLINAAAILCALCAGFVASSLCKRWSSAMVAALGLSGIMSAGFIGASGCLYIAAFPFWKHFAWPSYMRILRQERKFEYFQIFAGGTYVDLDIANSNGHVSTVLTPAGCGIYLGTICVVTLCSFLLLILSAWFAAWYLKRVWQEGPPSATRAKIEHSLMTPRFGVAFFKRWLNRKLEKNPIGWLEMRSWTGRTVAWGWFAVVISFYTAAFRSQGMTYLVPRVQELMMWGIFGVLALVSSGSFHRERETRVLEILLASPVSTWDIISGRLRGLWGQMLPSLILMIFVWFSYGGVGFGILTQYNDPASAFRARWLIQCCSGFIALPVIGLYYSLRRRTFAASVASTLFMGFLPVIVLETFKILLTALYGPSWWFLGMSGALGNPWAGILWSPVFIPFVQLLIALRCGVRLYQNLEHRKFVFT